MFIRLRHPSESNSPALTRQVCDNRGKGTRSFRCPEPGKRSGSEDRTLRRHGPAPLILSGRPRACRGERPQECVIMAEVEDPKLERSFRGHRDAVTSVVFNSNMKQLITGSLDSTVMVWNFKPQMRAYRFAGHKAAVYSVDYSASNGLLASGSKDKTVRLWQPTVEGKSTILKAHTATVRCVNFSADGRSLLTASDDKTLKVGPQPLPVSAAHRVVPAGAEVQHTLSGHLNWVRTCELSPDGRLVVSGSDDKTVKLWDVRSKECVRTFNDEAGMINAVKFHPDGTCIASSGTNNAIQLHDLRTNQLVQHYSAHQGAVTSIAFHPSGNFLLSSSYDATLRVWDLREGQLFYTLHGHEGATTAACFSPAGDHFASGGADEQVMVWKTNFDRSLQEYVLAQSRRDAPQPAAPPPAKRSPAKRPEYLPAPDAREVAATRTLPAPAEAPPAAAPAAMQPSVETAAPLNLSDLPEALGATLQHIVGQLDVLTQTMGLLEERVTMNEDKLRGLESTVATALDAMVEAQMSGMQLGADAPH
eukprot:jgi/Tetstr1/433152/TSEL_022484.t1